MPICWLLCVPLWRVGLLWGVSCILGLRWVLGLGWVLPIAVKPSRRGVAWLSSTCRQVGTVCMRVRSTADCLLPGCGLWSCVLFRIPHTGIKCVGSLVWPDMGADGGEPDSCTK